VVGNLHAGVAVALADVPLDCPHPRHLPQVGSRGDAARPRGRAARAHGRDQRLEVAEIFLVALIDLECRGRTGLDVGPAFALVEVLNVGVKGSEEPFKGEVVEALDVEVEAEVLAVDAQIGVAGPRARHTSGGQGRVGEGLADHRRVLDHVVEGHLLQPEGAFAFGEFQFEGGLAGQRPEGAAALQAHLDFDRRRRSAGSGRRPVRLGQGEGAVHVLLRFELQFGFGRRRQGQIDDVDAVGPVELSGRVRGGDGAARKRVTPTVSKAYAQPRFPPVIPRQGSARS